jgi:hypothetical protein
MRPQSKSSFPSKIDPISAEEFQRLFSEHAARLFSPLKPEDGSPEAEIAEAEQRLGFRLPGLLREFYRLAGRHEDIMDAYHGFAAPEELSLEEEDGSLIFCRASQGANDWAIVHQDFLKDDPPVYHYGDKPDIGVWELLSDRLSDFLLLTLYYQMMGPSEYQDVEHATEDFIRQVEALLPEIHGRTLKGKTVERLFSHRGQAVDLSLHLTGRKSIWHIWAAGRTEEDWEALEDALDWPNR